MEPLTLQALESFYIGGETVAVTTPAYGSDEVRIGAMYVQRLAPAPVTFPYPVVFIHGGLHTGATWETTPDGREGWQVRFVRGGFDTYVIDQAWRGRSAPDLRGNVVGIEPPVGLAEAQIGGAGLGRRFSRGGGRFPDDCLDQYMGQLWPDFGLPKARAAGHPGISDPVALGPLCQLLDRLGKVVLVTHSQGGHLGWQLAKARPGSIAGICAIEPGLTSPGLDDEGFPRVPVCIVWGDNLPEKAQTLSQADLATARRIAAARPEVEVDHLPDAGIHGNGHMLMMEDNSDELATRAMDWLRRNTPRP